MLASTEASQKVSPALPENLRRTMLAVVLGMCLSASALHAEPMPLSKLETRVASSLRLKAMETQIGYGHHLLRQELAKEGLQISGRLDAGRHKQIVTNSLTREYDALQPNLGLRYPLLGGRAQQLEASKTAETQIRLDSIDFDGIQLQLLQQLRKQYTLYWQYNQSEQLASQYLAALTEHAPAAEKLHEKGIWTGSEHLRYQSELASMRDELQRFRALQRIALNAMHSILGQSIDGFQPALPDLPQPCLSSAELNQSAERHSAELRRLGAQREALLYNRDIGAGSSVNADLHLGVNYIDDYTNNRQGYTASAGISINMPAGFQEAERANKDRLNAAIMVNRTLDEQARLDIQLNTAQAYENLQLARSRLEMAKIQVQTARESLRETRMQFDRVPYSLFNELMQKISQEYQVSLAEIESHSLLLQRTSELMLLAPDSCTGLVSSGQNSPHS